MARGGKKKKAGNVTVNVVAPPVGGQGPKKKGNKRQKKAKKAKMTSGMSMNPSKVPKPAATVPYKHMDMLNSMCSPWSPESLGCKYPDGITSTSIPVQNRALVSVATLAASSGPMNAYVFTMGLPYGYVYCAAPATTATTWTFAATYFENTTASLADTLVKNSGFTYRPVCGGIVIRSVQNAMTAQGTVIVSKLSIPPATGSTMAVGNILGDAKTYALTAGMEIPVLFKPSGINAYNFQPGNTSTTPISNWDCIMVEFTGCSGSSIIVASIEAIVNYEILAPSGQTQYNLISTPTPPNNPVVRNAVSHAYNKTSSIFDKGVEFAENKLASLAEEALSDIWGLFV
jgi:hypothetical protein